MRISAIASAAAMAVIAAAGCTSNVTTETEEASGQAIINGTFDTGDPAVLAYYASDGKGSGTICTCSLIAPRVCLTAAHCALPPFTPARVVVLTGNDTSRDLGEVIDVTPYAHPGYDPSVLRSPHDVAVAVLKRPLAIKPIPYNRRALDPLAVTGVRVVGYGRTNANDPLSAGRKMTGRARISQVLAESLVVTGNSVQCKGDSGGPSLALVDGVETIVGTSSTTLDDFGACFIGNNNMRVDTNVAFIDELVARFGNAPP